MIPPPYKMIAGWLRHPAIQNPNLINYDTITEQMYEEKVYDVNRFIPHKFRGNTRKPLRKNT
ncbi:MAG: hypothetical protein DRJ15_01800 [Bacteroidetes bacterium]|nr:MAG: hypothetical protein DRJ15_01800 [Bacteroidota bacterium]